MYIEIENGVGKYAQKKATHSEKVNRLVKYVVVENAVSGV